MKIRPKRSIKVGTKWSWYYVEQGILLKHNKRMICEIINDSIFYYNIGEMDNNITVEDEHKYHLTIEEFKEHLATGIIVFL